MPAAEPAPVLGSAPLPPASDLTAAQLRGTACVWCRAVLDNATAVDLSPRRRRLLDQITEWFPRSCPTCITPEAAYKRLLKHCGHCATCWAPPSLSDPPQARAECEVGRQFLAAWNSARLLARQAAAERGQS